MLDFTTQLCAPLVTHYLAVKRATRADLDRWNEVREPDTVFEPTGRADL